MKRDKEYITTWSYKVASVLVNLPRGSEYTYDTQADTITAVMAKLRRRHPTWTSMVITIVRGSK